MTVAGPERISREGAPLGGDDRGDPQLERCGVCVIISRTTRKDHGLTVMNRLSGHCGCGVEFTDAVIACRDLVAGIVYRQNEGGGTESIVLCHVIDEGCHDRHDDGVIVVDLLVVGLDEVTKWNDLGNGGTENDRPQTGSGIVAASDAGDIRIRSKIGVGLSRNVTVLHRRKYRAR